MIDIFLRWARFGAVFIAAIAGLSLPFILIYGLLFLALEGI